MRRPSAFLPYLSCPPQTGHTVGLEMYSEANDSLAGRFRLATAECPVRVVCHERRMIYLRRATVREMKEDPSEPSCRGRLQTAMSCFGQKLRGFSVKWFFGLLPVPCLEVCPGKASQIYLKFPDQTAWVSSPVG
jgi:hypothetical protein